MSSIGCRDAHTYAFRVYDKVLFSWLYLPPQSLIARYPATIISFFIHYYLRLTPPPQQFRQGASPSVEYMRPRCGFLKPIEVSSTILPTCITSPLSIVNYLRTITVSCGMGWSDAICVANDSILTIVHSPFYLHIGCSYRFLCYLSWS